MLAKQAQPSCTEKDTIIESLLDDWREKNGFVAAVLALSLSTTEDRQ